MISNLEKEITLRYLKTRKKDGFLNIITIFSFIGISLGVAVLIIVMSVMNGFRTDLIKKINGFNSHATIQNYQVRKDQDKINDLKLKSQINEIIISNNGEGILIERNFSKGVLIRGYKKNDFEKLAITQNQFFLGKKFLDKGQISISNEMGFNLNLDINDNLTLIFPSANDTLIGSLPKKKNFSNQIAI